MQHPDRDKYDLSSLTDIAAGGAPRPVAHVKRLQESFRGAQPALGYGLTETNAVGCGNFWQNYADKPASTGRPHRPIVELAILGDGDRHLPAGRARRDRDPLGRQFPRLLARHGGDRGRLHRRRLSSGPATSAISTRTIICSSSTARRTSSSAAARISAARRSRRRSTPIPPSPRRGVRSADERLGEVPAAVIYSEEGRARRRGACSPSSTGRLAAFKHAGRDLGPSTSRCPSSAPARSTRSRSAPPIGRPDPG